MTNLVQSAGVDITSLKKFLAQASPGDLWPEINRQTAAASSLNELLLLGKVRSKAVQQGLSLPATTRTLRCAFVGGCTMSPLVLACEQVLFAHGIDCRSFLGEFDNHVAEILYADSALYQFKPDVVFLYPSEQRCAFQGPVAAGHKEAHRAAAVEQAQEILDLCSVVHERSGAEVVLANFKLPAHCDLGSYRTRTLGSAWSFKKLVNLELGQNAPSFVHVCDQEFLSARLGTVAAADPGRWLESRQPGSWELMHSLAREFGQITSMLKRSPKKVLVLDLDNTLWGGIIGDDGVDGIDLGDTSPRGEAFKNFQKYIRTLAERGIVLAVCSKNEKATAEEPFKSHPETVLKLEDFAAFKANWRPKSDNIRDIATELELGLDSFVFVDDNPAEVSIVNQFVPEVSTILLGADPAKYVAQLQDARHFEPKSLTEEDAKRASQYRNEAKRRNLRESVTDMNAYLRSLEMVGHFSEFTSRDVPRISQLINKSNQFNLTTRRRTEAEVLQLLDDPGVVSLTMRLADRFGDHGLIGIVIGRIATGQMELDTWLMSCRVLERQVEDEVLNEVARLATARGCAKVLGVYLPTAKNKMVEGLYPRLGFSSLSVPAASGRAEYMLDVKQRPTTPTHIQIARRAYEPG